MSILPQTLALMEKRTIDDVADLVIEFVQAKTRDAASVAYAGEYETCAGFTGQKDIDDACVAAAIAGHLEIVKLMEARAVRSVMWSGVDRSTEPRYTEFEKHMIAHSASTW